ncbi:hypothetical protein ACO2TB_09100 [Pseudomonas putida]
MNIDTKPSAQTLRGIFGKDRLALTAPLSSLLRIWGLVGVATFKL